MSSEPVDLLELRERAVVGATPHDVVLRHNKMELLRYRRRRHAARQPILLVPALISRAYILDLYPGGSFVEYLVDHGWDVYLVDWGVPGDEDAELGLDNLIGDYLERAVERVRECSQTQALTLFGYCMGGTLCTVYAALHAWSAPNALVTLAAPVDFSEGGILRSWCAKEHCDIDAIVDVFGNVPAPLIEAVFMTMKPTTQLNAAIAYAKSGGTRQFDAGFFAMDRWVHEWVPFPGKAARQWIRWFYQENRLIEDRLELLGKRVSIGAIAAPVLAIEASADHIAPPAAVSALLARIGSRERELLSIQGGHVGIIAGRSARNILWPRVEAWLREHARGSDE